MVALGIVMVALGIVMVAEYVLVCVAQVRNFPIVGVSLSHHMCPKLAYYQWYAGRDWV